VAFSNRVIGGTTWSLPRGVELFDAASAPEAQGSW
jgi:hypothetical protein